MGTLRYMSPEQALAKHGLVDHRTDIYSLGVTLYELLTLRPAIFGLDREEVLKKIAFDEPARARQLNGAVPAELETIVCKAMSKEPGERYATAKEVADDLRCFLNDKPIRARRPSLRLRLRKWARRHTAAIWTAAAFLTLAAAALAAGGVWHLLEIQAALAEVSQREREIRRHLYVQDIMLARQALREGEQEWMRSLLDRQIPAVGQEDLRGFEWYYLQQCSRDRLHEAARVAAHEGDAYCVAYAPDGRTLASAGKDGMIRFWDAQTLEPRGELRSGQGEVNEVAFAPDGKTLASAGDDGTVGLWDLATTRQRSLLRPKGCRDEVSAVAISADGKVLAAGGKDGQVWSWDLATGELKAVRDPGAGWVHYLSFAPDGRFLAAATLDGRVLLLDPMTLEQRRQLQHYQGPVSCVSFSHDNRMLAAGSAWGGQLFFWDLANWQQVGLPGHAVSVIRSVSFSPNDTLLVTGGDDGLVRLWDVRSRALLASVQGSTQRVWCTTFAPDGKWLATASQDGTVTIWRDFGADQHRTIQIASDSKKPHAVDWVAFSPDGQTLFTREWNGGNLGRWSTFSGQRVEQPGGPTTSIHWLALAPGACLAMVTDDMRVLRVQDLSGAVVHRYRHSRPIWAIAISPDGKRVAFVDDSPTVWMVEVGSGQPRELLRPPGICQRLVFAPDGETIAVAAGACVLLLDSHQGQSLAVLSGHEKQVQAIAFSPDNRLLATTAQDNTVRVWEIPSGRERYCLWKHRTRASLEAVAFSPDGKTLATADRFGQLILWDAAEGQELMRLDDQREAILSLAFSPDGESGVIPESVGETCKAVEMALFQGLRGLLGGLTLARLRQRQQPER